MARHPVTLVPLQGGVNPLREAQHELSRLSEGDLRMPTDQQQARNWIRFLRQYGPVPQNENMYDEFIRRSADRAGVAPLHFEHPAAEGVLEALVGANPVSVVLTGTAGDGKTHLCRRVWEEIGGDPVEWQSPSPYLSTPLPRQGESDAGARTLHIVRDLSAWAPQRGVAWDPERERLLQRFSASIFADGDIDDEVFPDRRERWPARRVVASA